LIKEVNPPPPTCFRWVACKWSYGLERSTSGQIHNGSAYTSSRYHTSRAHCGRDGEHVEEGEKIAYSENSSIDFFLTTV